jgi:hypothetical protein
MNMDSSTSPSDHSHEHADPPHPFPIEVVYNGKPKHIVVTLHELIKTILDDAIKEFHVTQQPHLLSLFTEDGTELDDKSTVQQNGIDRKTVLYLRQSKVKGGAS